MEGFPWSGAGDQFAAGFLYGLMREYPLKKCAQLGCLAGGAVVQVVGAEMTQASWRWLFARCAPQPSFASTTSHAWPLHCLLARSACVLTADCHISPLQYTTHSALTHP
jgi:bifunctional ADP-heptose synthase (sugar kinase/adenylyltransferase)